MRAWWRWRRRSPSWRSSACRRRKRRRSAAARSDRWCPALDAGSLRALASELWNRNGYGAIGTAMIGDFPVFGVGVGGFHAMQADFARLHGLPIAPAGQRTELVQAAVRGARRRRAASGGYGGPCCSVRSCCVESSKEPHVRVARGMVVAFAAVSLVGMPGQEVPASITFWLAAFWYVFLVDPPRRHQRVDSRVASGWVLALPVGIFAVGTAWMAATSLRVPVRAQRIGWPYSYGFYQPETRHLRAGTWVDGTPGRVGVRAAAEWIAVTISADYRALRGSGFARRIGPRAHAAVGRAAAGATANRCSTRADDDRSSHEDTCGCRPTSMDVPRERGERRCPAPRSRHRRRWRSRRVDRLDACSSAANH